MRALWNNGMSMKRAHDWLQVRLAKPVRDVDVRVLAWAVQAPPEWLAERLFLVSGTANDRRLRLGTRQFSAASLLPGKTARVCPYCLSEFGYCDLSWSFRLAPICWRHAVPHLAACAHCGRTISWDRPQIDICTCGRYFRPRSVAVKPPLAATDWALWVARRLAPSGTPGNEARTQPSIPRILEQLTLDGAFRLVEAFGLLQKPDDPPSVAAATARSIAGAIEVICRGLERLTLIDRDVRCVRDLSAQIHVSALERLRTQAVDANDANCASVLLRHVGDRSDGDADMRGRYVRGQMTLFT